MTAGTADPPTALHAPPSPGRAPSRYRFDLNRTLAEACGAVRDLEQALDQLEARNGPAERHALHCARALIEQRVCAVLHAAYPDYRDWPAETANPWGADARGDCADPHPER